MRPESWSATSSPKRLLRRPSTSRLGFDCVKITCPAAHLSELYNRDSEYRAVAARVLAIERNFASAVSGRG